MITRSSILLGLSFATALVTTTEGSSLRASLQESVPVTHGDKNLRNLADRFFHGDDAARKSLLRAGPMSLRFLLTHRTEKRVRALVREIKALESTKADLRIVRKLEETCDEPPVGADTVGKAIDHLKSRVGGIMIDPALLEELRGRQLSKLQGTTLLDYLEDVVMQADADFRYFYGIVLVSTPDRLWPKPAGPVPPLKEGDRARARAAIPTLADDNVAVREEAQSTLKALGPGAIQILRESLKDKEPEIAARCRQLIGELEPKPEESVFRKPGIERQEIEPEDELFKRFRTGTMSLRLSNDLGTLSHTMLGAVDARLKLVYSGPAIPVRLEVKRVPVWTLLVVLSQAYGLDLFFSKGTVHIAPRGEVERFLASERKGK